MWRDSEEAGTREAGRGGTEQYDDDSPIIALLSLSAVLHYLADADKVKNCLSKFKRTLIILKMVFHTCFVSC